MKKIYIILPLLLLTCNTFAQQKDIKLLTPGSKAPDFNLPATDGKNYSLKDFDKYNLLVVIFTCNHCPTAQAYEDKIIKAVADYKEKGVGFVAISPNDPEAISLSELGYSDLNDDLEAMKIRAKEKGYNFPYLYDGDTQKVSLAYGPSATPHVFIFDKNRILQYSGRIDDTENPYETPKQTDMQNALEALLKGQKPPVTTTKTFGCSVKWSWKDEWTKKLKEEWAKEPVSLQSTDLEEVKTLMQNSGNKLRMINVWATWCGPCIVEFPELVNINRMYRDRDFEFISLSTDKPGKREKALELLQKFEASNQNLIFSGSDIYELIEVVDKEWQGALPYTALVAPGGEVIYSIEGSIEPQTLKKKIVDYLGRYYADDK